VVLVGWGVVEPATIRLDAISEGASKTWRNGNSHRRRWDVRDVGINSRDRREGGILVRGGRCRGLGSS
jgi:hypothetical protein